MTTRTILGAILLTVSASAQEYKIDSAHSSAQFAVTHMMVSTVRGAFSNVSGTVVYDEKNPANSTVQATVDATTVDTREPKRDADLRSANFFDVEKFPTLSFQSKKAWKQDGKLMLAGDLTMHGVTKEVTLSVEGPTAEVKDLWGGARRGATATTVVNRKDFGLMWNKTLEAGGVMVVDDATITLDVEMVRSAK